jgi:hypothetical protein
MLRSSAEICIADPDTCVVRKYSIVTGKIE